MLLLTIPVAYCIPMLVFDLLTSSNNFYFVSIVLFCIFQTLPGVGALGCGGSLDIATLMKTKIPQLLTLTSGLSIMNLDQMPHRIGSS